MLRLTCFFHHRHNFIITCRLFKFKWIRSNHMNYDSKDFGWRMSRRSNTRKITNETGVENNAPSHDSLMFNINDKLNSINDD